MNCAVWHWFSFWIGAGVGGVMLCLLLAIIKGGKP